MMGSYVNITETIRGGKTVNAYSVMKDFHYHNSYELYYLIKGKRSYIVDEDFFSVDKGDMVLIKPGVLHKTVGGTHDRIVINFTEEYLRKFFTTEALSIILRSFEQKEISIPADYQSGILNLLEKIIVAAENNEEDLTFICLSELFNTFYIIGNQKTYKKEEMLCADDTLTKILHYINKNYADIENISQIADSFFITKNHLCRIFKKMANTSVIEYLNKVKIKRACSLLETTDMKIIEIANMCGFNSSVYFGKIFKKLMNMTAVQYRKQYKDSTKK